MVKCKCWCQQLPTWCSKPDSTSFLVFGWERESMLSYLPLFRPQTVFPNPVRSPGGRGPPGWTWCPGRRGCRLRAFFCEIFIPIGAQLLKIPLHWRIKLMQGLPCQLLGWKEFRDLVAIASACQPMHFLHLGLLVFVVEVAIACLRWHAACKVDCCNFPFVSAALYGRCRIFERWSLG